MKPFVEMERRRSDEISSSVPSLRMKSDVHTEAEPIQFYMLLVLVTFTNMSNN